MGLPKRFANTKAKSADGQYCPFSIELIVWRVTPASAANCSCDSRSSARATLKRMETPCESHGS